MRVHVGQQAEGVLDSWGGGEGEEREEGERDDCASKEMTVYIRDERKKEWMCREEIRDHCHHLPKYTTNQ